MEREIIEDVRRNVKPSGDGADIVKAVLEEINFQIGLFFHCFQISLFFTALIYSTPNFSISETSPPPPTAFDDAIVVVNGLLRLHRTRGGHRLGFSVVV